MRNPLFLHETAPHTQYMNGAASIQLLWKKLDGYTIAHPA